jgi:hypothetical protein
MGACKLLDFSCVVCKLARLYNTCPRLLRTSSLTWSISTKVLDVVASSNNLKPITTTKESYKHDLRGKSTQ